MQISYLLVIFLQLICKLAEKIIIFLYSSTFFARNQKKRIVEVFEFEKLYSCMRISWSDFFLLFLLLLLLLFEFSPQSLFEQPCSIIHFTRLLHSGAFFRSHELEWVEIESSAILVTHSTNSYSPPCVTKNNKRENQQIFFLKNYFLTRDFIFYLIYEKNCSWKSFESETAYQKQQYHAI